MFFPSWFQLTPCSLCFTGTCGSEADGVEAAKFIAQHGPHLGFRTPNTAEGARAAGAGHYLGALPSNGKLPGFQRYNALSNPFDKDVLRARVENSLLKWVSGHELPARHVRHPTGDPRAFSPAPRHGAPRWNEGRGAGDSAFPSVLSDDLLENRFGRPPQVPAASPRHLWAPGGRLAL